jgi:hypothetical protein
MASHAAIELLLSVLTKSMGWHMHSSRPRTGADSDDGMREVRVRTLIRICLDILQRHVVWRIRRGDRGFPLVGEAVEVEAQVVDVIRADFTKRASKTL